MITNTEQILNLLKENIKDNKKYTLKELNALLVKAHTIISCNGEDEEIQRIAPSQYNKFIRETIRDLKIQYPEKSIQEIMQSYCSHK